MQSTPHGFADIGDQFLIAYACTSGVEASFASLFNVGHAAELYLKSALLHSMPSTDVSTYRHNVASLLRDVQSANPSLLRTYILHDRVAERWVVNPKYSEGDTTDPDFEHYNLNIELYWISRHLMDTKYLFASHKGKLARAHIALTICGLNEYWQPFFKELREFLMHGGVALGDRLTRATRSANMPESGRRYLRGIAE